MHRAIHSFGQYVILFAVVHFAKLCFVGGIANWASGDDALDLGPGVVRDAPKVGQYVAVNDIFMVPYRQTIPGTDAEFEMIPVPGGEFTMGSPPNEAGRAVDEGPSVTVIMEPFWIGKHEVTWAQYRRFMGLYEIFKRFSSKGVRIVTVDNRRDAITAPTPLYDPSFTFSLGEEPSQPAVTMSHYAAKQFTKWVSGTTGSFYRLPSEAEWEYACRAGSTTAYCFGDDPSELDKFGWYYENSDEQYHIVGEKQPNAWGIHDMHGNVAEMVLDQYDPETYQRLSKSGAKVDATAAVLWPTKVYGRVTRGGSWSEDPEKLRSAARSQTADWRTEDPNIPKSPWWLTDEEAQMVGFRIVRPWRSPDPADREKFWGADHEDLKLDIEFRLNEGRGVEGIVDPELPAESKR